MADCLIDGLTATAKLAPVRVWLWIVAALVFLMIVVGGATRLTESGLSITEWQPIAGVIPPLTSDAWRAEFDNYRRIPQFAALVPDMTLEGFKFIYFWEWGHRLLGRLIGSAFALPMAWFWARNRLPSGLKPKLLAVLALGGVQGLVGWWMVTSGLTERTEVSQYRLAVHLLLAALTFAALVWLATGLSRRTTPILAAPRLQIAASALLAVIFAQIGLGALVAGLRAGLTYNTWPLMDGHLIPPIADLTTLEPWWRNLLDNVTTVQFDHRMVAYGLVALAVWHAIDAQRYAAGTRGAQRAMVLASLTLAQASIGIIALVFIVPLWAGLLHQAVAMMVLAMATVHRQLLARESGEVSGRPALEWLSGSAL